MTHKNVAHFAQFDTSDFIGQVIEPAVFGTVHTSDEQSVAVNCPPSVCKSKEHNHMRKETHTSSKMSEQTDIDLTDPGQVAEAIARNKCLNTSILEMAAEKVLLEDKLQETLSRLEEVEEELSTLSEEFEQQSKMLQFATDHGIVGFKTLGRRFLEGFAAVAGGSIVFAYLFF